MSVVDDPETELAWLAGRPAEEGLTGYDPDGWEESTWVLHAMYEHPELPDTVSHHQALKARLDAGVQQPLIVGGVNLDETTTVTGVPLGYVDDPGPSWQRLRWSRHAARLGVRLGAGQRVPPCHRWFPVTSWPVNIQPPSEGSLDATSLTALLDVLMSEAHSPATPCFVFYGSVPVNEFDRPTVLHGPLAAIGGLVVGEDAFGSTPSNFWPADRSWFVWTDWDLWATKVSGSPGLVNAVRNHSDLETITWP
ncbi:MAG: hypothetical protein JXA67_21025 [Micromonosporaceae bacterium]|nr:hypothetical protein [Micromonosporaceae bacterium]